MAASTGAPCRDARDGEQGGGVEGLQGATGGKERGTGWAWLSKEHFLGLWISRVSPGTQFVFETKAKMHCEAI